VLLPTLLLALQIAPAPALQAAAGGAVADTSTVRVEREVWLMGTRAAIEVEAAPQEAGDDPARAAAESALQALEATEALLSSWDPATPLSRLNAAPVGRPVPVPADLTPVLATAWRWREATEGAFEPVLGALVDAWDLRGEGRRPSVAQREAALEALGPQGVRLEAARADGAETARWTRLHPDAWVDAGGFGKGAALARAASVLAEAPIRRARLELGGQLWLHALPDESWPVWVAHPVARDSMVFRLRLAGVSVATSGASERGITVHGERLGHLLDPSTGEPVPAWGSVTVVHPDPLAADALATALFVLGPVDGPRWLRSHPEIAALFLEIRDERVIPWHTDAMDRWMDTRRTNQPPKER